MNAFPYTRLSLFDLLLSYPCPTTHASVVFAFVPHRAGKYKQIREILEPLPERRFDPTTVRVPYVSGFGTAYVDAYEQVRRRGFSVLRAGLQPNRSMINKIFGPNKL